MTTAATKPTLLEDIRALASCPRELWLIFLATFLEYMGVFSFLPTLTLWLTSDYGMDDKAAGWWAATFSTLLTLFVFLVGAIADSAGIRRTLIVSFSVAAVTRLGMALAPSPRWAIVALLAFGFAFATSSPVLMAAVNRASNARTRAFAFSLWYVSFNLAGALCGPLIIDRTRHAFLDASGHLVRKPVALPLLGTHEMSANSMIMAWGFVFAVAAALVMLLLRRDFENQSESPPKKANPLSVLRDVVGNRTFWRLLVLMAFLALVKMMFQHMHFTWPKYVTREQGDGFPIGTLWSLNSLLILGLAPLGTALTRNRRPYDVMLLGACVSALSPLVLVFGSAMVFQIVTILVLTVGEALWSPRSYEYTVSIAPRGLESTYVALSSLPYFLAKFFVGPSSGYLLAAYCPAEGARHSSTLWAIIAASTILGPVGMLLSRGWMRKQEAAA